jgi:predicted transcriptional regulator
LASCLCSRSSLGADGLARPEKQRSPLRIYVDILNTVREEGDARPTRILYRANLSHDRLVKYLEELKGRGLVEELADETGRFYRVTPKGIGFIIEIRKAESFVEGFGLSL